MATRPRQPQFFGRVSFLVFGALIGVLAWAKPEMPVTPEPAPARPELQVPASGYTPIEGEPFFLLSDRSFGPSEVAQVRLEAPAYSSQIEQYGGVDLRVYRVAQPLEFLKQQRNLHRIQLNVKHQGEGLSNALSYLWDQWYKTSRLAWQRILDSRLRGEVVKVNPALNQTLPINQASRFQATPQFEHLPGMVPVTSFRYPVLKAKPIAPPQDVKLEGSSSEFLQVTPGNVHVPLGHLQPGLYVVQALVGSHRAHTLVFVSDTVLVSKISAEQLFLWTAHKQTGHPVAGAQLVWTDGAGVLQSGSTDSSGGLTLKKTSPEQSYVLGSDSAGGVFVSENFYYDSEIYSTKFYLTTDRPLYHPGDTVQVKYMGREFINARSSKALSAGAVNVSLLDATGTLVARANGSLEPSTGGDVSLKLPANASPGGYQLRARYNGQDYAGALRVAHFVKPHYQIVVNPDKPDFKTGEAITGSIQLRYANGQPVADAHLTLSVKAQKMTMVADELDYQGQFPVQVSKTELETDEKGQARYELAAAQEPSRYVLNISSSDNTAYRVSTTRELMIAAGQGRYRLLTPARFSEPKQNLSLRWQALTAERPAPSHWLALRLEDRQSLRGDIAPGAEQAQLQLPQPGHYTLQLLDAKNQVLGALPHTVYGPGVVAPPGSIQINFEHDSYQAGDTARALIHFSEPVEEALLTLERDQVEAQALLSQSASWVRAEKIDATTWRVAIPVQESYSPNLTFSVLAVKHGDYVFQNRGLVVAMPKVDVKIQADKTSYRPGDEVVLRLETRIGGKATPATLSVAVVDEMIYAVQPEIAPDISEFFYHIRRNNVRTGVSLNFHSYDLASSPKVRAANSSQQNDRPFKVAERPRREDKDTAAWVPNLRTDAQGQAVLRFKMPDALTRWRITARAATAEGVVGQNLAYVQSNKALYLKWLTPAQVRPGDQPKLGLALFNTQNKTVKTLVRAVGLAQPWQQALEAAPGMSYLELPVSAQAAANVRVEVVLAEAATVVQDSLALNLSLAPSGWDNWQRLDLSLSEQDTLVKLPADARNLRLSLRSNSSEVFASVLDELVDYPYGCIEQTASRMIPLSIALADWTPTAANQASREQLEQRLMHARLRLVQMAGPQAQFAWWGQTGKPSLFLTAYAYHADHLAAEPLGLSLPADHAEPVLKLYQTEAKQTSSQQRAWVLWLLQDMGQPIASLREGLVQDLLKRAERLPKKAGALSGGVMADTEGGLSDAWAWVILQNTLQADHASWPEPAQAQFQQAAALLASQNSALAQALLINTGVGSATVPQVVQALAAETPTLDRALGLLVLRRNPQSPRLQAGQALLSLSAPWREERSLVGRSVWQRPPAGSELHLTLNEKPAQPLPVQLNYSTSQISSPAGAAKPGVTVGVTVQRQLYKLEPTGEKLSFKVVAVKEPWVVDNTSLYVDELTLTAPKGKVERFGLLDVALPPGALVENTSWGLRIEGLEPRKTDKGDEAAPSSDAGNFTAASSEVGELSYAVPVPELQGRQVFRQLLRFSGRGSFSLPASRYWRMYQPQMQAFERQGRRVDVQ